ncbi:MAG: 23S rRNA (adenine(2503)-C(2))-methyltransferase RlmN [Desulfobacterales bacterium]|jgi:23S rRNA (adenine2503-C2)-methyltransferase
MIESIPFQDIKDLNRSALLQWLQRRGEAAYRVDQIWHWIYRGQVETFDAMSNLSKSLRAALSAAFVIGRMPLVKHEIAGDGAEKFLFELADKRRIESVLIPERNHTTLCISSQVGCAQNCRFCFTATGGWERNLTLGEILAQVRDIKYGLGAPESLTNIVFMGMGEPLANYRNVVDAIHLLTDKKTGLGFSRRKITVSTAGLVPQMAALGRDTQINLAISLNAADNDTRSRLMPINRRYPIEVLLEACCRYPLRRNARMTFEYILLQGVNDRMQDARQLAKLLRPIRAKINLIPFNEHAGCGFRRPSEAAILQFQQHLIEQGYTAIIRHSKGGDIAAACGQLKASAEGFPER